MADIYIPIAILSGILLIGFLFIRFFYYKKLFRKITFFEKIYETYKFGNIKSFFLVFIINIFFLSLYILLLFLYNNVKNSIPILLGAFITFCYTFIFMLLINDGNAYFNNNYLIGKGNLAMKGVYFSTDCMEDIFIVFNNYYYPKKYRAEFGAVLELAYKDDLTKFKTWLDKENITVENLYYKMVENKEIQREILELIKKTEFAEKKKAKMMMNEKKEKYNKEELEKIDDFFKNYKVKGLK